MESQVVKQQHEDHNNIPVLITRVVRWEIGAPINVPSSSRRMTRALRN